MLTQDQSRVMAFLEAPATHGGLPVERVDTHASVVFLAGPRAYKLKRAVRYDYLDFGTVERRRTMCEAEVRVNRRTAAGLYLGALPISETPDGKLHLGADGTPIEWVVEMARFDQENLLDRRAESGRLPIHLMPPLGEAIAAFHAHACSRLQCGGWEAMRRVVDGNAAAFAADAAGVVDAERSRQLTYHTHVAAGEASALLDARRDQGFVRECHGDLHLRNVVLLDGQPTLFDAIEFNDEIACVDVLYDLAFLLMDLWRRQLHAHANAVWNSYLAATADFGGLPLMPLFLSCRAAIRAKTSATAATLQADDDRRQQLRLQAREYVELAEQLLQPPPSSVIAIGGLSGSGKSTLARSLAPLAGPAPGAVVLRTDAIRRELLKATATEYLGPEAYTPDLSQRVYAKMAERADIIARSGHTVVADAVFAREADRDAIRHVAAAAGVPFVGLWLEASQPILTARVEAREKDISDADADVVREQVVRGTGIVQWHRLDGVQSKAEVHEAASRLLPPTSALTPATSSA